MAPGEPYDELSAEDLVIRWTQKHHGFWALSGVQKPRRIFCKRKLVEGEELESRHSPGVAAQMCALSRNLSGAKLWRLPIRFGFPGSNGLISSAAGIHRAEQGGT